MKIKSALATQMSGSLGGITASHNRGGLYLRARAIPTNPNTQFQQTIRAIVGQLAALWHDTLTGLQRTQWDTYALQVPIPDRLGEPRNIGGLAMYIRSNTPRLQASMERVDDGPTDFTLPGLEVLNMLTPTAALREYDLDYQEEPQVPEDWLSEDGAALLNYSSRIQNNSINYFKGPYRNTTTILGDSITPATAPFTIVSVFTLTVGTKLFARCQLTRADGRLSLSQFFGRVVGNGPAGATDARPPKPPKEGQIDTDADPKVKKSRRKQLVT